MKTIEINGKKHKVSSAVAEHIEWLEARLKAKLSVKKKYKGSIDGDVDDVISKLTNIRDKVSKINEDI